MIFGILAAGSGPLVASIHGFQRALEMAFWRLRAVSGDWRTSALAKSDVHYRARRVECL
jgi:hypothetical protein